MLTTLPMEAVRSQTRLYDPWKVLLHNDDHNSIDHVVDALQKAVTQLQPTDAQAITLEAHQQGVALVIRCPQEHAEMYAERLQSYGLVVTIEAEA